MQYILDQQEYDSLTGKFMTNAQRIDEVIGHLNWVAFQFQGKEEEQRIIKALSHIRKVKESCLL
jgi:hypothetical protein